MKPALLPPTLLSVLLLAAIPLQGQQIDSSRFDDVGVTPAPPVPVAAPAAETTPTAMQDDRGFSFKPILHVIGGALVGGWVGYVGAQVVKSDWDKETNGTFVQQRTTWMATGAALGVLGSWIIGGTRSPRPGPLTVEPRSPRDRGTITTREIRESRLQTALEVVRNLRSDWLQTRGTNSWKESPTGTMEGFGDSFRADVTPGRDKIVVYLDDIRIGGVDDMADIPAGSLTSIRFVDGRQATFLYGSGHAHGAILLSTRTPAP